jgi:hypothetical protein
VPAKHVYYAIVLLLARQMKAFRVVENVTPTTENKQGLQYYSYANTGARET